MTKPDAKKKPDREAALGALRTIWQATWISELHASLIRAADEGDLPSYVTKETIAWHCTDVCMKQANRQMSALERLEKALGMSVSFASGEQPDDVE